LVYLFNVYLVSQQACSTSGENSPPHQFRPSTEPFLRPRGWCDHSCGQSCCGENCPQGLFLYLS